MNAWVPSKQIRINYFDEASFSFKHSNPINIPTSNQSDGLCITVDISL
jgi:hypothetical protein